MSKRRSILGPSKDEIWTQIATEIGGEFIEGGFWDNNVVVYKHGEWQIVLDTCTVTASTGATTTATTYTRMRAPFINKDGLYFNISREGFFSSIGKFFGMQDIEIGDPFFDDQFVIKGNSPEKIKLLLPDDRIRELCQRLPRIHLWIKGCLKTIFFTIRLSMDHGNLNQGLAMAGQHLIISGMTAKIPAKVRRHPTFIR